MCIDNELMFQLKCKHVQVGNYLLSCNIGFTNDVGIMSGLSGLSLILALYYQHTSDERYLDKLNQSIDLINDMISAGKNMTPDYCHGIAGYAWLINYLRERDLVELDV